MKLCIPKEMKEITQTINLMATFASLCQGMSINYSTFFYKPVSFLQK